MTVKRESILGMVVVPAIITLVVLIARLVGEIMGGPEFLFGTEAGGSAQTEDGSQGLPALIGIAWLVPIFGYLFGRRLQRQSRPSRGWASVGIVIAGIAVTVGAVIGLEKAGLFVFPEPDAEPPTEPQGIGYFFGALAIGTVFTFFAWPRLALTMLFYGLLARIPVVVVTWIAVGEEWGTHFEKLPPGVPSLEGTELLVALSTPQLSFWLMFTLIVGGLVGTIAAALPMRQSEE